MANMLRKRATKHFGCCDHCARGQKLNARPGPRARHQARAIEKRRWRKEEA